MIDASHDPALRSWVPGADGHADFPIQNLPLGTASFGGGDPQGVIAIGDHVLVLLELAGCGLLADPDLDLIEFAARGAWNDFLTAGPQSRRRLRMLASALLAVGAKAEDFAETILRKQADCGFHVPMKIGDYTDFFAGIHHARMAGSLFRPDNPLFPNYRYVPIGYHGRASSIRVSGHPVHRPIGQSRPDPDAEPRQQPTAALDYELELGLWIGKGSNLGESIPIGSAGEHLAGISLLNDWSARDIQRWEYQPLGPFLAKSFLTSVSPWIVTVDALLPFRSKQPERPADDPRPLPYLFDEADQSSGAFDIDLEVFLETEKMRQLGIAPVSISKASALDLYWTPAQLIAHHSSNGCDLNVGDLLGTGTISTEDQDGGGCLLERTRNGQTPLELPTGEQRAFLERGDKVVFKGRCSRDGYAPIGFGALVGEVTA